MDRVTYYKSVMKEEEFNKLKRFDTLPQLLACSTEEYAELPAIEWKGGGKTYAQLAQDVAAMRGLLAKENIPVGAHVGVMMKNSYDFVRTFLAISTSGRVAVLLPPQFPAPAVPGALKKYNCVILLADADLAEGIKGALAQQGAADMKVLFGEDLQGGEAAPAAEGLTKETPAAIVFSGGTTGMPKGALLSHGALLRGAYNGTLGFDNAFHHKYMLLIPFTHVFGLVRNLLTPIQTGSCVYLIAGMKEIFTEMPSVKPTTLVLVPALADLMLKIARSRGMGALGGNLQYIIAGGAPVNPATSTSFVQMGVRFCPGYGLTETANLVSGNADVENHPTSVGMPYEGQDLKIVNGELWIKGDHLFSGYYGDEEKTAAAMEDGYFKTGDLARLDEEGFLYIVGRAKNIILTDNGENVSPEELEAKVNLLPLVRDCLAYQDVNERGAQIIVMEVLPDMDIAKAMQVENVVEALRPAIDKINAEMPSYMQWNKVIFREEDFPRSPAMKIIRPDERR